MIPPTKVKLQEDEQERDAKSRVGWWRKVSWDTSVEAGILVLVAQFDRELNSIPKRCPIAMSHQYCGAGCEGEERGS